MILVEFLLSPSDTCKTYLSLLSLHSSQIIDIDLAKILQALSKYLCLCVKLVCFAQRFVLASYMLALCLKFLPSYNYYAGIIGSSLYIHKILLFCIVMLCT